MSEMTVTRQDGTQVVLVLWRVDRKRRRVGIDCPACNARLIFTEVENHPRIISKSDRRIIDPSKPVQLHVSKTVYEHMAMWAGSILNSHRREVI